MFIMLLAIRTTFLPGVSCGLFPSPAASGEGPVYSLDQQPGGHWQSLHKKKSSVLRFRMTVLPVHRREGIANQACGHSSLIEKGLCTEGKHGTLLGAGSAISSSTFHTRNSHFWCLHKLVGVLRGLIPARPPGRCHPNLGHFPDSI